MRKLVLPLIAGWLAIACPHVALAQSADNVAAQDLRLAQISDAMLIANRDLCRATMPVTGMVLHSADQFGPGAQALFANGPLTVALTVPGSPAAVAGLQRNDGILAIGEMPVGAFELGEGEHLREAAFFHLGALAEEEQVQITVERNGQQFTTDLDAPRGCLSLVEILLADGPDARSDGRIIQLQYDFAASLSNPQIAVVLAHELAHVVLEHRRRKEEAGIDNESVMRHLGRNQLVNRQAEVEADRLSVHLLANAGYDPMIAAAFWRSPEGIRAGGGTMPSFIYPSQAARAELIEREVAMFLPLGGGPSWPGHLLELRERSFAAD